jgi:Ran GTPase-activating protein (RanGAP) involved in mRNA processing and transport
MLFVTGNDSSSILQRLMRLKDDPVYTELYISMVHLTVEVSSAIIDVLRDERRAWEGLHIARCTGRVDAVIAHALKNGSMQKLSLLPGGHQMNDQCLYALAKGLKVNSSVNNLVLRVDLYEELSHALAEGLSANSSLKELSLILSTSDTAAIQTLAKGVKDNSHLKTLKLNRCSFEDGQVAAFVRALENHTSLQELSIQGASCQPSGMVAISGLLQSNNTKPFKLDLSNQNFERNETFGISFLAPALPANRSMRFLDLSRNELSDVDLACIASALSENSALEDLKLTNCNISNKGAKIIAKHLPQMTTLKTLWLFDNPFGVEGAERILQAIPANVHLEQVLLPRGKGKAMDTLQQRIDDYCMLNRGGRRLLGDLNSLSLGLWSQALARVGSIDWGIYADKKATQANVVYFLLKNGPALFAG